MRSQHQPIQLFDFVKRRRPVAQPIEATSGKAHEPDRRFGAHLTRFELGLEEELSPSLLEVLALMADGLEDKEIALVRHTSWHTSKTQVRNILARLNAKNRTHAVAIGFRRGLLH